VFSSYGTGYWGRDIRFPKTNQIMPSTVIKSPDGASALVFQPDKRLAMWKFRNNLWYKQWQSPPSPRTSIFIDNEGYLYAPEADDKPSWGWQAVYQTGNPYRASKAPFSIKIANDATIHMYRGDGTEVQMETPFPTTAWVDTPVNCIPGPIMVDENEQIRGCQVGGGGVASPSNFTDYSELIPGKGECRYARAGEGTPRDTSQDRPAKNGGKACQPIGTAQVGYNGGTIYANNTERCIASACIPNLAG
jgi:hypothetical protein